MLAKSSCSVLFSCDQTWDKLYSSSAQTQKQLEYFLEKAQSDKMRRCSISDKSKYFSQNKPKNDSDFLSGSHLITQKSWAETLTFLYLAPLKRSCSVSVDSGLNFAESPPLPEPGQRENNIRPLANEPVFPFGSWRRLRLASSVQRLGQH